MYLAVTLAVAGGTLLRTRVALPQNNALAMADALGLAFFVIAEAGRYVVLLGMGLPESTAGLARMVLIVALRGSAILRGQAPAGAGAQGGVNRPEPRSRPAFSLSDGPGIHASSAPAGDGTDVAGSGGKPAIGDAPLAPELFG